MNKNRCHWVTKDQIYIDYHDNEWGKPIHNDQILFEMINLEGAQAGLNWLTILKRRDGYKKAFANFDAKKLIKYDQRKIDSLMQNEGIIRNKLKIYSVFTNAKAFLAIQKEFGSFDKYIWSFTDYKIIKQKDRETAILISQKMSKDLKKRGFKFIGGTIAFAFMQAVGMINDHEPKCFCSRKQ